MKLRSLFTTTVFLFVILYVQAQQTGIFTDTRDDKPYKTVKIGNQTWLAENLACKLVNGCWSANEDEIYVKTYGYVYDWETAKKACPEGWHLPTDNEWKTLELTLGMPESSVDSSAWRGANVAGKLKEAGIEHWYMENGEVSNISGFTALPGGTRCDDGSTIGLAIHGTWWTASEQEEGVWIRALYADNQAVYRDLSNKSNGSAVRCVKDESTSGQLEPSANPILHKQGK